MDFSFVLTQITKISIRNQINRNLMSTKHVYILKKYIYREKHNYLSKNIIKKCIPVF